MFLMRSFTLAAVLMLSFSLFAERELTIGEYSEEIRAKVTAKLREALTSSESTAEVCGTVTYSGNACFFLQRDRDGMKVLVESGSGELPPPGRVVQVMGKPSLDGGHVVFRAVKWIPQESAALPVAQSVRISDLAGRKGLANNWLRVKVSGRTLGLTETGFAIESDGFPVNVVASEVPPFLDGCDHTHPFVEVTGVADLVLDQSSLLDSTVDVMGVKVHVSEPADIELKPDIFYLSRCHERTVKYVGVSVIATLAAAILIFLVIVFRQNRRLFRSRTIMAERKRMADDLHDTIEQHLVGAGMLLKLNRLKEAQDVLVRAKREIRDIVWGLKNDDMMRLSPAEMLRKLAHEENAKGICRVDTRLEGLPGELDAAAMRDLSLIVREAIGNAVKHGGAKHIAISSDPLKAGGWLVRIANDGEPFDPQSVPGAAEGHFGLEGMRQRAVRLGAEMTIARRKSGMVVAVERKL